MATIMISILIVVLATAVIIHMVKQRKSGKSSCGCDCGSCPLGGKCHERK